MDILLRTVGLYKYINYEYNAKNSNKIDVRTIMDASLVIKLFEKT